MWCGSRIGFADDASGKHWRESRHQWKTLAPVGWQKVVGVIVVPGNGCADLEIGCRYDIVGRLLLSGES